MGNKKINGHPWADFLLELSAFGPKNSGLGRKSQLKFMLWIFLLVLPIGGS